MTNSQRIARLEDGLVGLTNYLILQFGAGVAEDNAGAQAEMDDVRRICAEIQAEGSD